MSLSTIDDALTQFNANANWYGSQASAALRLEAIEFLLINRAQRLDDAGSSINYESMGTMATELRKFLGAGAPRAFGRSRRVGPAYCGGGIQ